LNQAVDEARAALETELLALGVASLAEARDIAARRREAVTTRDSAAAALDHVLAGSSLAEFDARLAETAARLAANCDSADTPGSSLKELDTAAHRARVAERAAEDALSLVRDLVEDARHEASRAREAYIRAETELQRATVELDRAEGDLAEARWATGDDALREAERHAERVFANAAVAHEVARDAYLAVDPDTCQMHLDNAIDLVESTGQRRDTAQGELREVRALLADRAGIGLYEKREQAAAALDAGCARLARLERSAKAIVLLRDVLLRHRAATQAKYVAPFKERIERLGRIVLGQGLAVEVSPDLTIESRTVAGQTVPFASLSAGTQEQLGLLGRLVCAELVDPAEGAPVILDDSLGFADPGRLRALGVVLAAVGRTCQVILLTCQPDRFAHLGGAHVITLPPVPR
jgi:uncharacterized protein YhaN